MTRRRAAKRRTATIVVRLHLRFANHLDTRAVFGDDLLMPAETIQSATVTDPHRADIARRAGEIAARLLREAEREDKIRRQVRLGGLGNDDTTTVG